MFKIGEFSKMCGLSADTLYHYEKMNILIPVSVDRFTGYRLYDASQLVTVNKILALKDAGFSLEEISRTLNTDVSLAHLLEMLEQKAQILESNLSEEYIRLERLHTNIFLIKNGGIPQMSEITIKKVEPILIASIRRKFPREDFDGNLENMWSSVNGYIDEKGIKKTYPCMMLYHSGWSNIPELNIICDEKNLDVETAEAVTREFSGNDEVAVYELPKIEKMACIVHHGSFADIEKAFSSLFEWIKQNNYVADGAIREIYHKGDWVTDNPDEYITEIQIPVKL